MILRILAGSVVALGLGLAAEQAHAAQTFLCQDGRLLQVELHDLDRMKRDDPCVAAHYGLKIKPVPLPVKRPARAAAPLLKGTKKAAKAQREIGNLAQSTTSFRTVRIINARPNGSAWFKHTR